MGRMKLSSGLKNDSKVARALGITPQAISNYRKRGNIPADVLLKFSEAFGVSVDWLVNGDGEIFKKGVTPLAIDKAALREAVMEYGDITSFADLSRLDPDELVTMGKLLKILRDGEENSVAALKNLLDSFARTTKNSQSRKAAHA